MTPSQWARVFHAGSEATRWIAGVPSVDQALRRVLNAMAAEAQKITDETR